jgi:hypothetical protein
VYGGSDPTSERVTPIAAVLKEATAVFLFARPVTSSKGKSAHAGLFQSRSGDHNGQTLGQQWLGVR